jgi:hypothetical protein
MRILPIDFDVKNALQTISDWVDMWSVERYGKESLKPEYYYNQSKDGRYLFGVKHNEEKATIDHVRELLLKIKNINYKLSDDGQIKHLNYGDREKLKTERQALYDEYVRIVSGTLVEETQSGGEASHALSVEPHSGDKFVFETEKIQVIFAEQQETVKNTKLNKTTYNEFAVMVERGDFTSLLKTRTDGHVELSNVVCRLYYQIWRSFTDKNTKDEWKKTAETKLMKINPKANWKHITSQATKTVKNSD